MIPGQIHNPNPNLEQLQRDSELGESLLMAEVRRQFDPFMHAAISAAYVLGVYITRGEYNPDHKTDPKEAESLMFLVETYKKSPLLLPDFMRDFCAKLQQKYEEQIGKDWPEAANPDQSPVAPEAVPVEAVAGIDLAEGD